MEAEMSLSISSWESKKIDRLLLLVVLLLVLVVVVLVGVVTVLLLLFNFLSILELCFLVSIWDDF